MKPIRWGRAFALGLAVVFAWISLAASSRRRRDFIAAFGLNLLAVLFLCRALNDLGAGDSYYVTR